MLRAIAAVIVAIAVASPAMAWRHGTAKPCPFGVSLGDGCPGAPQTGPNTFQVLPFFSSYAQQSLGCPTCLQVAPYNGGGGSGHAPQWNVAGVDYPVGSSKSTLQNPLTANLPAGCSLSGTTGNHEVSCNITTGASVTIDGFDFSQDSGIYLSMGGTNSNQFIVKNSRFQCPVNNSIANAAGLCVSVRPGTGNQSAACATATGSGSCFVFEKNWMSAAGTTFQNLVQYSGAGGWFIQYNYIAGVPARAFTTGTVGAFGPSPSSNCTSQFNFLNGMTNSSNAAHGEWDLLNSACGTIVYSYNVMFQPASAGCAGCDITAFFAPYEGIAPASWTSCTISGTALSCSNPRSGTGFVGSVLNGAGVTANSILLSGSGNSFTLSQSSSVGSPEPMTTTVTFPLLQIDHNIIATNLVNGVTGGVIGTAVARVPSNSNQQMTQMTIVDNYVDPTGADQCFVTGDFAGTNIVSLTYSGNTNLLNGSNIPTSPQSACYGRFH